MWALEYDPDLFSVYEEPELNGEKAEGSKGRTKSIRHYGKFERENMKNGAVNSESPLPISIFLVASVLKDKSSTLLQEARGLDDVVKVSLMSWFVPYALDTYKIPFSLGRAMYHQAEACRRK